MDVRTSITHTLNVVEKKRGYWSSSSSDSIVTKYVIQVSLAMAGREPVEWQVARRYSHFRSNHSALSGMFSQLQLPRLPPPICQLHHLLPVPKAHLTSAPGAQTHAIEPNPGMATLVFIPPAGAD